MGQDIEGTTLEKRGELSFRYRLRGSWPGDVIAFKRETGEGNTQAFDGKTRTSPDGTVRMEGRFGVEGRGAWAAKCNLRERVEDAEPPRPDVNVDGILVVTLGDPIRIRAEADDNVEVASVTVFVDGSAEKTCQARQCAHTHTASEAGPHRLWAEARDLAGNKATSRTLEFMVHPTGKPGPSLTLRTDPFRPTSRDPVRFIAEASHSSGVRDITIHVGGRAVLTCPAPRCEYTALAQPAGTLKWRVSARSQDGAETYGSETALEISPAPTTGACSISGRATGSHADAASVFSVMLFGPDDERKHRETRRFDPDGRYRFSGLPDGRYWLRPDTRADIAVGPHPPRASPVCRGAEINGVDFEFR